METDEDLNKSVLKVLLDRGPCNMRAISIMLKTELNEIHNSLKSLLHKRYIMASTEGHFFVGDINKYTYVCIRPSEYNSVIIYINN